jgi:hypothetical protein
MWTNFTGTRALCSDRVPEGLPVSLRGRGFVHGITATPAEKAAAVAFQDMNTLILVTPALEAGPQQLVLANANGESVSRDSAFVTQ